MTDDKNYDELLFPILHNEGQITGFLDSIFSFLYRRTDFFRLLNPGTEGSIGLPSGAAENLVKQYFSKYYRLAREDENIIYADQEVPHAEVTVEIPFTTEDVENVEVPFTTEDVENVEVENETESETIQNEEKLYQNNPECYNGAVYENYSWSQSIKDIDVQVKVPKEIVSGKQVQVVLRQQKLKIEVLEHAEWKVLVDGEFPWIINAEESIWTLVPGKHIHVCLEKTKERWWDALFITEPKIDVKNIDASQPYEDLDEESQAKIRELMFNEQQKRLGKPTSEQTKIAELLRDAWDLEGSPFRGQPFDPNVICAGSSGNYDLPKMSK